MSSIQNLGVREGDEETLKTCDNKEHASKRQQEVCTHKRGEKTARLHIKHFILKARFSGFLN